MTNPDRALSRREKQIMDVLHRRAQATAAEVLADLPDPPSYSAVRALLRVLENKGQVVHSERGRAYLYRPATSPIVARRAALKHVVTTFFGGSVEDAAATLLDLPPGGIDESTRQRLADRIAQARREGR